MERKFQFEASLFSPFTYTFTGQNSSFQTSEGVFFASKSRTHAHARRREKTTTRARKAFLSSRAFCSLFLSLSLSLSLDVATVSRWTSTTSRLREQTKRRNEKSKSGEREDDSERCFCCALWWQNQRLLVSWIGGDDATRGANFFFEFVFEFERFWNT